MQETQEREIPYANVFTLDSLLEKDPSYLDQAAELYFRAWERLHLSGSLAEALFKVERFDPKLTLVATDPNGVAIGTLHRVQVYAASPAALFSIMPTYADAERMSMTGGSGTGRYSVDVCFALSVPERIRVVKEKGLTIAQVLLKSVPQEPGVRILAYSRVNEVAKGVPLLDHVRAGFEDPRLLGPVGLHEHMGGIAFSVLDASRIEDGKGGKGNVWAIYPSKTEEKLFSDIKQARKENPEVEVMTMSNDHGQSMHIFKDIAQHVAWL